MKLRRGLLPTPEGLDEWEEAFAESNETVAQICRKSKAGGKRGVSERTVGRFRKGEPHDERALLLIYHLVGIKAKEGVHYRRAPKIVVPEAPARQTGAYIRREDIDDEIVGRIVFTLRNSVSTEGLLVSIEGDGGAGKTRLALEILKRVAAQDLTTSFLTYEHVSLPNDQEEAYCLDTFIQLLGKSFGFEPQNRTEEDLVRYLVSEPALIVLDNLETVQCAAVSELLRRVIRRCPRLAILCTSRLSVGAEDKHTFTLEIGMTLEEGISLLRTRMIETLPPNAPARRMTTSELGQLVALCGGIPLAIENLAAIARTGLQPSRVAKELASIKRGLPDPLDITSHFRNAVAVDRNRSMESTSVWGYRLIDKWGGENADAIRRAYRTTGIFPGPFTNDDFEAVAGRGESRWLADLHGAHLLGADQSGGTWSQNVFRRGFTTRLAKDAGEWEAIESRFVDHFFGLLLREGPLLGGPRANWDLLRATEPNWVHACYLMADRIVQGSEEAAEAFHAARTAIQNCAYQLGWDASPLLAMVEEAAGKLGAIACQADCARWLGIAYLCFKGNSDLARTWYEKALRLYTRIGDLEGQADALRCLADCVPGHVTSEMLALVERARELVPKEEVMQKAWIERRLSVILLGTERGKRYFEESCSAFLSCGRYGDIASNYLDHAWEVARSGDLERAMLLRSEARPHARRSGDTRLQLSVLLAGLDWQVLLGESKQKYTDLTEALADLAEAKELVAFCSDPRMPPRIKLHEAEFLAINGRVADALGSFLETSSVFQRLSNWESADYCRKRAAEIQSEFAPVSSL